MQHFEAYFKEEYTDPRYAELLALQSYRLGLHMIANSSWLQQAVHAEMCGQIPDLCPNAIDHTIFYGDPSPIHYSKNISVISYGGRNVAWKGFQEMAEAMAITRSKLPDYEIDWRVYGSASLPPSNAIAQYTHLGFLNPTSLAEEYRKSDILLSASWYESFPLFPIEAMACGLAVITTQPGTEEYAFHGKTVEVVQSRSPASIAEGLIRLITDPTYRHAIAVQGCAISKNFTWETSVQRMEHILLGTA